MNVFQLVLKQMRQRSLSTVLTVFSVMLGVGLATAVLLMQREADTLLGGDNFGYSVVVGPKGDPLQIVLNNAYGLGSPTSTMQWDAVEQLREDGLATQVVPIAYGDTYDERRIIATEPVMFAGMFEPAEDVVFRIADGENFRADRFEAVVGAEVPMEIGAKFQPVCGDHENPDAHVHAEEWTVVGKAAPTGTVFDRNIYISLPSFFAIPDHGEALNEQALALASTDVHDHAGHDHAGHSHGHDHGSSCASCSSCSSAPSTYVLHADGSFDLLIPEENWRVTAAFVTASGTDAGRIAWRVNNGNLATAAFPGQVMRGFFDRVLLAPSWVIFGVAVLVVIVAGVSILVSIYNSTVARRSETATLRALGATRRTVLALLCLESALIGTVGAVLGWLVGKGLVAGADIAVQQLLGRGINAWRITPEEIIFVAGVIVLAVVAGLVPGITAYRTPVAHHIANS